MLDSLLQKVALGEIQIAGLVKNYGAGDTFLRIQNLFITISFPYTDDNLTIQDWVAFLCHNHIELRLRLKLRVIGA